jgi:hypothetical protein
LHVQKLAVLVRCEGKVQPIAFLGALFIETVTFLHLGTPGQNNVTVISDEHNDV